MGRGAGSAFGLERIVGCISKNASRSVRNSAWSATPDSVEKIMLDIGAGLQNRARQESTACRCVSAPITVRQMT